MTEVTAGASPLYWACRQVVRALALTIWRMRVIGAEHVPATGPVILAGNHVTYLDPPVLGCACPRAVTYMAKKELFAIPLLGPLIAGLHAFPVDRKRGDVAAIKRAVAALHEGRVLGIFPEGTRNVDGTLPPQLGIGLMIKLAGEATVVPAYVDGTREAKRLHSFTVRFGEPLRFTATHKASREDLANWTSEIMARVYALREKTIDH